MTELSTMCVFQRNGLVISSNMTTVPKPPGRYTDTWPWGRDVTQPGWLTATSPFMAYVPKVENLRGPLFNSLCFYKGTAPLKWVSSDNYDGEECYSLLAEVSSNWVALEDGLVHVRNILAESAGGLYSLNFTYTPLPSRANHGIIGFQHIFKGLRPARNAAMRIRMAFQALIGSVAMLVSRMRYKPVPVPPSWVTTLLKAGVPPAFVDLLTQSEAIVPTMPYSQVGTYVLATNTEKDILLAEMNRANVPFWIVWAKVDSEGNLVNQNPQPVPNSTFARYWPTLEAVQKAETYSEGVQLSHKRLVTALKDAKPDVSEVPDVIANSGQRRGQTWEQFMEERANIIKAARQLESPAQAIARDVRFADRLDEATDKIPSCPVWEWFDAYADGRYYIRRPLGPHDKRVVWKEAQAEQRVYDRLFDCWDIVPLRNSSSTGADVDYFDDIQQNEEINFEHFTDFHNPELETVSNPPRPNIADTWNSLCSLLRPPSLVHTPWKLPEETVGRNLHYRLGFIIGEHTVPQEEDSLPWEHFLSRLGIKDLSEDTEDTDRPALQYFISCLEKCADPEAVQDHLPPASMWDLHPQSVAPLTREHGHFKVQISDSPGPNTRYLLMPRQSGHSSEPWVLCVPSAYTATLVMRSKWGPSLEDVVHELILRNLQFSTCVTLQSLSNYVAPPVPRTFSGFRVRPVGWLPGPLDLLEYLHCRDAIFQIPSVKRAALMRGGIVGRIAQRYTSEDDVLDGPVDPNLRQGHDLIDDDLTTDELGMICGVMHYFASDKQKERLAISFFPEAELWETSGSNFGEWQPRNEGLFAKIMEGYCASPPRLDPYACSRTKWRTHIKGDNHWKRAFRFYNQEAETFLKRE